MMHTNVRCAYGWCSEELHDPAPCPCACHDEGPGLGPWLLVSLILAAVLVTTAIVRFTT
jgi:hypothetical protein